jgi:hypothetical protein
VSGGGYNGTIVSGNRALGTASLIGGGLGNTITTTASYASIMGGESNTANSDHAAISGGGFNTANGAYSTVGGGSHNTIYNDYATIGGGENNTASGSHAAVGGGAGNNASGGYATVGGGDSNTANSSDSTVGGGYGNTANGLDATVGGGWVNTASAVNATVGGGQSNTANGYAATIPGGAYNSATMSYTLAAGHRAKANHDGAFVWADSTNADFASTANDQFLIRANGGVGINTTQPRTTLEIAKSNGSGLGGTLRLSNPAGGANSQVALDFATYDAGSNAPAAQILANDAGNYSANLAFQTKVPGAAGNSLQTNMWLKTNGTVEIDHLGSGGNYNVCMNNGNEIAYCSSSLCYKNHIADLTLGLDVIAQLRPVTFDWKDSGQADLGFVAEDVNQVTPLLTTLNAQGQIEGVKYDRITAVLVKGMQEQQAQIVKLQRQNAEQLAQIHELQAQVAQAQPGIAPESFNVFNLISVFALLGMVGLWRQQRRAQQGGGTR